MTDSIKIIYNKNIALLGHVDKAIYYFRRQQHDVALGIIADSMNLIRNSIESTINDNISTCFQQIQLWKC